MFGFTTRHGRDQSDPLQTRKTAAEWFRNLPALDVIGRQEHVIRAFSGLRHARPAFDLDRIAAIVFLDGALAVDRRRVFKWYFENLNGSTKLADRFRQAALDVSHGFIFAYHAGLEAASRAPRRSAVERLPAAAYRPAHSLPRRRQPGAPVSRRPRDPRHVAAASRVVPAGVRPALRALGPDAAGRGSARDPGHGRAGVPARTPDRPARHREPDARRTRLGEQPAPRVEQAPPARHRGAGGRRLLRRPRRRRGIGTPQRHGRGREDRLSRYHAAGGGDRPCDRRAARARSGRRDPPRSSSSSSGSRFSRRSARCSRPAAMPTCAATRASPSISRSISGSGCRRITRELTSPERPAARGWHAVHSPADRPPRQTRASARRIAILHSRRRRRRGDRAAADCRTTRGQPTRSSSLQHAPAAGDADAHPPWRVNDRSAAGWRISAPGGVGQSLALGALVAMSSGRRRRMDAGRGEPPRQEAAQRDRGRNVADREPRRAGHAVRTAAGPGGNELSSSTASTSRRGARDSTASTSCRRRALDTRLAMRTLIIPTSEYFEGRSVILSTRELELRGDAGCRSSISTRTGPGRRCTSRERWRGRIGTSRCARPLLPGSRR